MGYKYEELYKIAVKEYIEYPFLTLNYFQDKYGFSRHVFANWLKKNGYKVRPMPLMTVEKAKNLKKAVEYYKDNECTAKDVAVRYGLSASTVLKYLKKMGLARRTFKMPDEIVYEDYFSQIDSEEKAYWLGFIAADGCIRTDKVCIELNTIDENHLKKFISVIGEGIPIHYRKTRPICSVSVHRPRLMGDLCRLGCVKNKTIYGFINRRAIKGFEMDFVRGYVDGDGYIEKNLKKHRLVITLKAPKVVDSLMDILSSYSPRFQDCGSYSRIHIDRKNEFFRLLDDLYGHATVYLDRKYETYKNRMKAHSGQHCGRPEGITEKKAGMPA